MGNLYITTDSITMKDSTKVTINSKIDIHGTGIELPITIEADFSNVPNHLHEVYLQTLINQYN